MVLDLCIFLSFSEETAFRLSTHILARSNSLKLKNSNDGLVSYKHAAFPLMDCSGVDYCDVFISCLDSHSDGTHSLQSIHWWASDVMLHFSKSDEKTNPSINDFDIFLNKGIRVSPFSAHFYFWGTIP